MTVPQTVTKRRVENIHTLSRNSSRLAELFKQLTDADLRIAKHRMVTLDVHDGASLAGLKQRIGILEAAIQCKTGIMLEIGAIREQMPSVQLAAAGSAELLGLSVPLAFELSIAVEKLSPEVRRTIDKDLLNRASTFSSGIGNEFRKIRGV